MNMTKSLTAIAFSFGIAQTVLASVTTSHFGDFYIFDGAGKKLGDSISSNVLEKSFFSGDFSHISISSFKYSVVNSVVSETSIAGKKSQLFSSMQSRFSNAGSYLLNFSESSRNDLALNLRGDSVAESHTWVMSMVGLGLICYQLRRKQRQIARSILPLYA